MLHSSDVTAVPSGLVATPPAPASTTSSNSSDSSASSSTSRRSNRRRQRPGSRKRRALASKQALAQEMHEGLLLARDPYAPLPYNTYTSPHTAQQELQYSQSWARWKAREAEAEAEAETAAMMLMTGRRSEQYYEPATLGAAAAQCKMFGGDVGDDTQSRHSATKDEHVEHQASTMASEEDDETDNGMSSSSYPELVFSTRARGIFQYPEALDSGARLLGAVHNTYDYDDEYDTDDEDEDDDRGGYQIALAQSSFNQLSADGDIQRYMTSTTSIHKGPDLDSSVGTYESEAESGKRTNGELNPFPSSTIISSVVSSSSGESSNDEGVSLKAIQPVQVSICFKAPFGLDQHSVAPLNNPPTLQQSPIFPLVCIPGSPTISTLPSLTNSIPSLQSLSSTSTNSSTSTITHLYSQLATSTITEENPPLSWSLIPSPPSPARDSWIFLGDDS